MTASERAAPIAIAGAGIAGLASAIALDRAGVAVRVVDRRPDPWSGGGYLQLWSNAIGALHELGVGDAVLSVAHVVERTEFRDWAGDLLAVLDVRDLARRAGGPTVIVRRAALVRTLAEAAGPGLVSTGNGMRSFVERDSGVEVRLADGEVVRAAALIGADGLGSSVREALFGPASPRDAGVIAWSGVSRGARAPIEPGVSWIVSGRGVRLAAAPCGGGDLFWLATARRSKIDAPATQSPDAVRAQLARLLASSGAPLREIVETTPADEILMTAIRDRRPARRWGRGRTTLIGDAAHPATPDLGQGACQAIESAVALGRSFAAGGADARLDRNGAIEKALRAYEVSRRTRAALVTHLSWATMTEGMRDDPIFCWCRDAATAAFVSTIGRTAIGSLVCGRA